MTNLEQAILDKVKVLDIEQQQRVLEFVETLQPTAFDYEKWENQLDEIHAELREKYGEGYFIDVQRMLDEIREEASWLPRMS